MDRKSQARLLGLLILGILVIGIFSFYFVSADDPEEQQTITRTATTDTSCVPVEEIREIIQEDVCLDWDERNWTEINCDQYNRRPNNNCNIYNNYQTEEEINCEQYNLEVNRTNCSALGDTPRIEETQGRPHQCGRQHNQPHRRACRDEQQHRRPSTLDGRRGSAHIGDRPDQLPL